MRDRLTAIGRRGADGWKSFSPGQKAVTIFAILALAIGGWFFASWSGQPTMAPLFSNLAAADASAIVDKLNADGVTYSLSDGGGTVNVPADQVYALRIEMSGAGLPAQGDAGYALLDKQGIMTSEFMQQVTYRRALEGELAKTIGSIKNVNSATVHLAIPEKDVFTDDQQAPTASVLVNTGTQSLTGDQVTSIVHLVSSSVEGLEPGNVTVVSAGGKVLSTSDSGGSGSGGDGGSAATSAYEQRLRSAVQNMLDTVVGPGHAAVNVTAALNYDNTETKTQKYVADPAVPPLSEQKKSEQYTGGNGVPVGGVLGPDNIQVPNGTGAGGDGQYQQTTETRNNAVGMVTETTKSAPGQVSKLGIAVIVDSSVAKVDLAQLQQLVSSAVGLDPARGDQIAVSSMAFDTSAATAEKNAAAEAAKGQQAQVQMQYIQMGAIVLALLILLIVAALANRKRRKAEKQKLTEEQNAALADMQAAIEAARAKLQLEGGGGPGGAAALEGGGAPGEEFDRDGRFRDITTMVEKQPDEVAQLLRGWLADRRS
ncbi:flagellar basal-body MS-ring/collar protein FliF [Dactylosporangium matsuzakiense]|uniref:Flagellar M-ring protein n=1 Tax=Dactylosporangium matsuzakiense TaxID=53360 RepID=A0A9W6KYU3_9ACTN|nr:flagellar basal-body MS-ring/collar protein FliF [Dactylosporangium matsuzakiense]UWZ43805.1 flagellar M-ring protein FliF [Dactylosporangium matsuzakiense]GLL07944.1 flagellar M-ring protein [Dactylosporangium matsuzakiense]